MEIYHSGRKPSIYTVKPETHIQGQLHFNPKGFMGGGGDVFCSVCWGVGVGVGFFHFVLFFAFFFEGGKWGGGEASPEYGYFI